MKEQNLENEVSNLLNKVLEIDSFDLELENNIDKVNEVSKKIMVKSEKSDVTIDDVLECEDLLTELRYSIEDKELRKRYSELNKKLNDLKRPALKKLDDRKKLHKKALDLSTKLIYIIEDYKLEFMLKLKDNIKDELIDENIDLFMIIHDDIVDLDFIKDRKKSFIKVKKYVEDFNKNYDKYYFEADKIEDNKRIKASSEDVQNFINKQLEKFYLLTPDKKQFNYETIIKNGEIVVKIK